MIQVKGQHERKFKKKVVKAVEAGERHTTRRWGSGENIAPRQNTHGGVLCDLIDPFLPVVQQGRTR